MTKRFLAAAFAVAAVAAAPKPAEALSSPDSEPHEIRVVNNHQAPVRVYVQDAEGRMHQLGRVARGTLKILEVPAEITQKGPVRVKVYPAAPPWALVAEELGIRSKDLDLRQGDSVNVFLETELSASLIEVSKG